MAKRKYPKSREEDLKYRMQNGSAYASWNTEEERIEALSNYSNSIDEFAAASRTSFSDITTYQSGRPGFQKGRLGLFASRRACTNRSKGYHWLCT